MRIVITDQLLESTFLLAIKPSFVKCKPLGCLGCKTELRTDASTNHHVSLRTFIRVY